MGTALTSTATMSVRGRNHGVRRARMELHGGGVTTMSPGGGAALKVSLGRARSRSQRTADPRECASFMTGSGNGLAGRNGGADAFTEASRIRPTAAQMAVDAAGTSSRPKRRSRRSGRLPASLRAGSGEALPGDGAGLAEIARRSVQRVQG